MLDWVFILNSVAQRVVKQWFVSPKKVCKQFCLYWWLKCSCLILSITGWSAFLVWISAAEFLKNNNRGNAKWNVVIALAFLRFYITGDVYCLDFNRKLQVPYRVLDCCRDISKMTVQIPYPVKSQCSIDVWDIPQ